MQLETIILAIITAILGGGNVWQAVTIRSYRRKQSAEADRTEIENLKMIISTFNEQMANLQSRYDNLQDRYDKLLDKYDKQQEELRNLKDLIRK